MNEVMSLIDTDNADSLLLGCVFVVWVLQGVSPFQLNHQTRGNRVIPRTLLFVEVMRSEMTQWG